MTEAQRYPDDYDGINVGGSANYRADPQPRAIRVERAGDVRQGGVPLAGSTLALINDAAVAACDALDGVLDGVIDDPLAAPLNRRAFCAAQVKTQIPA